MPKLEYICPVVASDRYQWIVTDSGTKGSYNQYMARSSNIYINIHLYSIYFSQVLRSSQFSSPIYILEFPDFSHSLRCKSVLG